MSRWLALALVPAGAGLLLGLAFAAGVLPATFFVLNLQVSTSVAAPAAGLALSGLLLLGWWLRRRFQRRLAQAVQHERDTQAAAHRRFVRRLDHELKNPLTAIRAGLANVSAEADGSGRASLANVGWQVERLSRLAHDLRKLADLETVPLDRAPVDLADLLPEAVELAQAGPGRDGRTLSLSVQQVPWPVSPVPGDRDLLLLAVYNLLDNALKFSAPSAAVEVRARDDGTTVAVEVADTGCGIAAADLPHVAEELYRGQAAAGIEGSGLGLALVQRIALLHGGDLLIRSRAGQGTVVTLLLPVRRA